MGDIFVVSYLILLSTVKFLFVPFLSVHVHNYNFLTASVINIIGSFIGITFFFKTSTYFIERGIRKRKEALEKGSKKQKESGKSDEIANFQPILMQTYHLNQ